MKSSSSTSFPHPSSTSTVTMSNTSGTALKSVSNPDSANSSFTYQETEYIPPKLNPPSMLAYMKTLSPGIISMLSGCKSTTSGTGSSKVMELTAETGSKPHVSVTVSMQTQSSSVETVMLGAVELLHDQSYA